MARLFLDDADTMYTFRTFYSRGWSAYDCQDTPTSYTSRQLDSATEFVLHVVNSFIIIGGFGLNHELKFSFYLVQHRQCMPNDSFSLGIAMTVSAARKS